MAINKTEKVGLERSREALVSMNIGQIILVTSFVFLIGLMMGAYWFGGADPRIEDGYWTNIITEGVGVLLTVIIIGLIQETLRIRWLKKRLIRQAGSISHPVAINAVEELRQNSWLTVDDNDSLLVETRMMRAKLIDAPLERSNLSRANLGFADLTRANLESANMHGTLLYLANLLEANLRFANLTGADLKTANLQGANLSMANLSGADLSNANLHQAQLESVILTGANLRKANLERAKLWGANLEDVNLQAAILPDGTQWSGKVDMRRFTDWEHPEFRVTLDKIEQIGKK